MIGFSLSHKKERGFTMSMQNKKQKIDMLNAPFLKKILLFAIPLMLTGLLQIAYNAADVIVVGRFAGSASLAAVGSTSPLINLILNLFMGFATGSGVVLAILLGARDRAGQKRCVHSTMAFSALCGVFVAIFGFLTSRYFLSLMDTPKDVIDLSTLYLKIYFLGAPGSLIYNFGAAILRANGDTKRPLIILSISGIINVVLNLILVIVFHLDVAGVAIATIAAQYISSIMVVLQLSKLRNSCRLSLLHLHFHPGELKRIIKIGLPAGLQGMLFSLSNVIIQSTVNSFGAIAMAGSSASQNVDSALYICSNAFAQASMTFSSQNIGGKRYENLGRIFWRCAGLAATTSMILGTVSLIFSTSILSLFSKDAAVIAAGKERVYIIATTQFINALMDVAGCQLRGMDRSLESMFITLIGSCGVRILWIYAVFPQIPSLFGVFLSYPISWFLTFAALLLCYLYASRKLKKQTAGFQSKLSAEDN